MLEVTGPFERITFSVEDHSSERFFERRTIRPITMVLSGIQAVILQQLSRTSTCVRIFQPLPLDNCCTFCSKEVLLRQQSDCSGRWQHRLCNTGISLLEYRMLTKLSAVFEWRCCQCSPQSVSPASPLAGSGSTCSSPTVSAIPLAESTRRTVSQYKNSL